MIKHINDDEFTKEVLNKKGVMLVDFYTTWCGPCMMLAPVLEEISNSRAGYNIIKVDVDKNPKIANELKIDAIPTICIYKDGKLVEKYVGFKNKEEIIEILEKHV